MLQNKHEVQMCWKFFKKHFPNGDFFTGEISMWQNKQAIHLVMTLVFMASSKFKLKNSLTRCRTSHLNACTFMEHAHPSYAHIVSNVTYTLGEIQTKI